MSKLARGYLLYGVFICAWLAYANATGWKVIDFGLGSGGGGGRWGSGGHTMIIYHK